MGCAPRNAFSGINKGNVRLARRADFPREKGEMRAGEHDGELRDPVRHAAELVLQRHGARRVLPIADLWLADGAQNKKLEPGEILFLPVGWWHYVEALDISVTLASTNFQFFKAYAFAALVYLALVSVIVIAARALEKRVIIPGVHR